ncbi:TetR/AcrR family transcriptional regulator [Nocardia sp. NPDC004068]|uniref:TetR/AcrR family transcriptional regulator n=1 Tax=Nocardia sp. NPDC004068 TaxID=3364303 RepID=UPI0036A40CE9
MLSREQIVAEAIELLDTEGFEALSMRRLGTKLNAGATSLYTHVANKDELLELVVDETFGEIRLPATPPQRWRPALLRLGRDIRAVLLRHPWITGVLSTAGLSHLGPNMMRLSEALLTILESAGFDEESADRGANVLLGYVIGATSTEAAMLTTLARSGLGEPEWLRRLRSAARAASSPYPRIHRRYTDHHDADPARTRDAHFDTELGIVLDALELRRLPG